jgi:hypothetical protein
MTDDALPSWLMHEAVAAVAGVLGAAITFGYRVHAMTEEAAQVPHLLRKAVPSLIRIGVAPQ